MGPPCPAPGPARPLQVPEEAELQFGAEQPPPPENGSTTGRNRYSPTSMLRDAAAWVGGLGRTPRPGPRVSVNPINRAATDAKYVTTQQVEVGRQDSKVGAGFGREHSRRCECWGGAG